MTIEQLRTLHQASPFRPFTIHLADGRSLHVPYREFLSYSPTGRTVIVHGEGEAYNIIDLRLVTRLEVNEERPKGSRKRA